MGVWKVPVAASTARAVCHIRRVVEFSSSTVDQAIVKAVVGRMVLVRLLLSVATQPRGALGRLVRR